jgi:hypothetical protein
LLSEASLPSPPHTPLLPLRFNHFPRSQAGFADKFRASGNDEIAVQRPQTGESQRERALYAGHCYCGDCRRYAPGYFALLKDLAHDWDQVADLAHHRAIELFRRSVGK